MTTTGKSLGLTRQVFHAWQCDHFGHVNTRAYAAAFDDAIFVFWSRMGQLSASAVIPVTVELKTAFKSEATAGTVFDLLGSVSRVGKKSVSLHFEMVDARTGELLATCDVVEVFLNGDARSSAEIPEDIRASLQLASSTETGEIRT